MAFDERLADRVRAVLRERDDVEERRMFGGLCFLVSGKMACGITRDGLMVRVGRDRYAEALAEPHARPMDFTGKPMRGIVYVAPVALGDEAVFERWVSRGAAVVEDLAQRSTA